MKKLLTIALILALLAAFAACGETQQPSPTPTPTEQSSNPVTGSEYAFGGLLIPLPDGMTIIDASTIQQGVPEGTKVATLSDGSNISFVTTKEQGVASISVKDSLEQTFASTYGEGFSGLKDFTVYVIGGYGAMRYNFTVNLYGVTMRMEQVIVTLDGVTTTITYTDNTIGFIHADAFRASIEGIRIDQ